MSENLTPYDHCRIAMEMVGAVVGSMNGRDHCPSERHCLLEALDSLEAIAEKLEPSH